MNICAPAKCFMVFAAISYMLMAGMAYADTATFTADGDALDNVDLENITATGGGGFNLQGGSTLVIELTNAFATGNFDNFLTVYYANPQRGRRWLGINIGYEVNGVVQWILASPSWFLTRGTGQLNLQVFSNQCSVAGGCTHISLTTWGNSNQGVYVDAVAVNGQVLTADTAAPTPEPSTWMLMILGFFAVAWALKRRKRDNRKTVPLVTALQP